MILIKTLQIKNKPSPKHLLDTCDVLEHDLAENISAVIDKINTTDIWGRAKYIGIETF